MKKLLLLIFACAISATGFAQAGKRIMSQKVAYFTEQMNLTPEESQKFWPLYNEMNAKINTQKKEMRGDEVLPSMSEKDANIYLDQYLSREQTLVDLKKQYIREFRKILPAGKVAMLPGLEKSFNRELLRKLNRRGK